MSFVSQEWWTAAEIGEANLPGLPGTRQGVVRLTKEWRMDASKARRRKGRGGGWEYHWKLFPQKAQRYLAALSVTQIEPQTERVEDWSWYDELPDAHKNTAKLRLKAVQLVEQLEIEGHARATAVTHAAFEAEISERTLWNWLKLIEGVAVEDRLPALAPRYASGNIEAGNCSIEFYEHLKAAYLTLSKLSFNAAYRKAERVAKAKGWTILPLETMRRRLKSDIPRTVMILKREGYGGLARCFPPQIRDRTGLYALEAVNADCHALDIAVSWPDEKSGGRKAFRAYLVSFQDIFSGKILSWRIDVSPNAMAVMSAFGDVLRDYGIPKRCLFDNGREFANKGLTAGAKTRFRFKIKEDEPVGLLVQLGIKIHWATPAHGQAKPIERAFRDIADSVSRDPRFIGAYLGNTPNAKPEDYGSRAIPIEDVIRVTDQEIAEHNARIGRRSATCKGRSFDQTFADSYAGAVIPKPTEEQLRLLLMAREVRKLHKQHGGVTIHGNRYHADWMSEYAGQDVAVHFDPENLHDGVQIYSAEGHYMGFAPCQEAVGFFDIYEAKANARRRSQINKTERKLAELYSPVSAQDVGKALDALEEAKPDLTEAKVIRMIDQPKRPEGTLTKRARHQEQNDPIAIESHERFIREIERKQAEVKPIEDDETRFARASAIEDRIAAGEAVGDGEASWLKRYQTTSEYQSKLMIQNAFKTGATKK